MKYNLADIILYLDDINSYVNSILFYHSRSFIVQKELDLKEILMYLSCTSEIIQDIKDYIYNLYYSKEKWFIIFQESGEWNEKSKINIHFTLETRIFIEEELNKGSSITNIAKALNREHAWCNSSIKLLNFLLAFFCSFTKYHSWL